MEADPTALLSTQQAADQLGVTYRILDYWTRQQVIAPAVVHFATPGADRDNPGSGSRRWWHPDQLPLLRTLVALNGLGATVPMLAAVRFQLETMAQPWGTVDSYALPVHGLWITPDGTVVFTPPPAGWWIAAATWEP